MHSLKSRLFAKQSQDCLDYRRHIENQSEGLSDVLGL